MIHPPFRARAANKTIAEVTGADYITKAGAKFLAAEIKRAWADQGIAIQTFIVNDGGKYCVRSTLVNGLPPKLVLV